MHGVCSRVCDVQTQQLAKQVLSPYRAMGLTPVVCSRAAFIKPQAALHYQRAIYFKNVFSCMLKLL